MGSLRRPNRLTERWPSADGIEIKPGDRVRSEDGAEGVVTGRSTHRTGFVPMVSGLSHPDELNAHVSRPASECVHVDDPHESTAAPSIPPARLTTVWLDVTGTNVPVGATVIYDGGRWTVKGRFTAHRKAGLVPSLALKSELGGKGRHAPSREVTLASQGGR